MSSSRIKVQDYYSEFIQLTTKRALGVLDRRREAFDAPLRRTEEYVVEAVNKVLDDESEMPPDFLRVVCVTAYQMMRDDAEGPAN
ncbi:MAG: hypothetical protein QOE68_3387 [Thermoanaerobaculia bacterium]|jgi:hypothetical protein|nr:hypothetical protein [Thermoanaerobaculia bacterium]